MRLAARIAVTMVLTASTACAGWARTPLGAAPIPAYKQYQVWTRDTVLILKTVKVEHDSLTGVSLNQDSGCLECRLALPLAAVDSVREGETTNIGTTAIGVVAGMIAALMLFAAALRD